MAAALIASIITLAFSILAISNRRHINRLERRVRALGVVEMVVRQASSDDESARRHRHLHSVV